MEFNPSNKIVQSCLQSMQLEAGGNPDGAENLLQQSWNEAGNDFERFLVAHALARHQKNVVEQLKWYETALQLAQAVNNLTVQGAFYGLHTQIAQCYAALNDPDNAQKHEAFALSFKDNLSDPGPFFHGTKADLQIGDMLIPGFQSNYQPEITMNHIYFTAMINGAGLAAALAKGDGPQRVYVVEPTGNFENDPNVTDKKFPGNPTRSYRTLSPLKIIGEIRDWEKQTPEELQKWREKLANNKGEIIN